MKKKSNISTTAVEQIDRDTGTIIAKFDSMADAERAIGINSGQISKCVQGKRKDAGGFVWRRVGQASGSATGKGTSAAAIAVAAATAAVTAAKAAKKGLSRSHTTIGRAISSHSQRSNHRSSTHAQGTVNATLSSLMPNLPHNTLNTPNTFTYSLRCLLTLRIILFLYVSDIEP